MPLRFGNPIKLVLELSVCGRGETFEKRLDSERLCWLLAEKLWVKMTKRIQKVS